MKGMQMKKYYYVTFKWDDTIFCTNIAHANNIEAVENEYSKYKWYHIRKVQTGELDMAKRKGMPIIELEE